ncbi:hypothetical protein HYH02_009053 [Chlamydomonas schloesseri]|uniref:Uncharacterized protein n=1 Tax=Chlamydomonas schloesseri TaxID=2026947 RepID=A0A836B0R3_9CHLO|nr:hypothetical protein HYH02_009053 [Chlamydomonas schloesseri]|eukprot:KAG2444112.1 hypothetical protein HYH02_009053 [Chlamydomonas schloesseri]
MGKSSAKSQARRPVNYWSKFNDWWRTVLDETGRRPEAAAINKWYEENAADTWAPHEMPTVLETRVHAKCLRSVDEVRNYFRAYRAQRRADAMHGRDNGRDCGDEGDPDVPAPRGGSRRPGTAPSKTGTHKSGVTKVVASSGRSSRSLGGRAGSSQYGTEDYATGADSAWPPPQQRQHSLDQTHMTHMAGSYEQHGGHMSLQHPPLQLPSQQHRVRIHIRQASAGSGSANVSSGAITGACQPAGPMGLPRHPPLQHHQHQQHYQHQHLHQHQMRNSAQLAHSPPDQGGVDGKEGRPDVQRGDMAYATTEAPCSSVSTASLDDLLRLHDENDMALQDDAAYCAAMGLPPHQQQPPPPHHQQQQPPPPQQQQQQLGSAPNALGSGAATGNGRGGRSGGSGSEGINLKQVMQQRHSAPTLPGLTDNVPRPGMHGNPQLHHQAYPSLHSAQPHYGNPQQHQYQQIQQQQQLQLQPGKQGQAQQMPQSQQRSSGNIGDLGSMWDELDGASEPTIYAQLTLLPRSNVKLEPQPEACTQQEQQGAGAFEARQHQQQHHMLHQQNQHMQQQQQQQHQMLQMQNGSKPARVLWSPLLSVRPMPVAPQPMPQQQQQYAQNSGVVQHAGGMQGGQQCHAPQQMQQALQQPPALPPFPSGWGLPPLEQQAQAPRISVNGSAVVPMDGVSCQQDAVGWTRDAAPPLPASMLMGTGGGSFGNGLSALQIRHEPHELNKQPNGGPAGQSGCSSVAGLSEPQPMAGSAPTENLEQPMSQPSQPAPGPAAVHSLWASEQGGDTEMVASGVAPPQAPHNTPTWYTPHMQQQQQQPGQPHDAALQQRLLQLQSAGGSGSAGPSPLPTPTGPPSASAPSAGQLAQSPSMPAVQQPQQHLPLAPVPPLPPLPPFPPRHQPQQPQQSAGPTPQPSQPPVQHQRSSSSNSGMMTPGWANQQPGHLGRPLSTSSSCSSWQSVPSAPASVQQPLPVPPSVPGSAASGPFSTMMGVRVTSWSSTPENSQGSGPATLSRPFEVSAMSQQLHAPSQPPPQPQPQHQEAQKQSLQPAAVAMPGCPNTAFANQQHQQNPVASVQQQHVPAAPVTSSPVRVRRFSQPGPDEQSRLALLQQHRHFMQEQLQAQHLQQQQQQQLQAQHLQQQQLPVQQAPQQTQTHMLPPSNSLPCVLPDIRTSMADAKVNSQAHGNGTGDGQTPALGRHVVTTGNATRPPLMRTLSAPPSETPSANVGAGGPFGDAAPVPQGHGTSGSGMALPGVTPRNQMLQAGGAGGGFGTPGMGMTSPAGWGDSALAELEGDSAWLRNMLAPDSLTSSLWG